MGRGSGREGAPGAGFGVEDGSGDAEEEAELTDIKSSNQMTGKRGEGADISSLHVSVEWEERNTKQSERKRRTMHGSVCLPRLHEPARLPACLRASRVDECHSIYS